MSKRRGKPSEYISDWTLKFGLEVSTRDLSTNEVTSALCLFCRQFGREDGDDDVARKRKRTMNCKYFSYPWRSDNFTSHLKKQHLKKWTEYNSSSLEDKQSFFLKNESAEVVNMRSFVQPEGSMKARIIAKQKCKFIIDAEIVESLIGGLLFDKPNDEEESFNMEEAKHRALRHFVHNQEDNSYVVEVKSVLKLDLLNQFASVGVSFLPGK